MVAMDEEGEEDSRMRGALFFFFFRCLLWGWMGGIRSWIVTRAFRNWKNVDIVGAGSAREG